MCLVKIINRYPAKSALYKFYKEHNEEMFEDLYEPFLKVVEGTNLEEDFDILVGFSNSSRYLTNV